MKIASDFIRRFKRVRKEHGFAGMFYHFFRNRVPLYKSLIYCTNVFSKSRKVQELNIIRYSAISELSSQEIEPFVCHGGSGTLKEFEKISADGAELWLGCLNNQVAGICWSKFEKTRSDYFVPLDEKDATISSCFVFPKYRGKGIYPAMIGEIANTRISEGATSVYIDCKAWNTPSSRGIQKAGFCFLGDAWRISLGRWSYIFRRNIIKQTR